MTTTDQSPFSLDALSPARLLLGAARTDIAPPETVMSVPAGVEAPLFYTPGATAETRQWKAQTFQLVNWGGFEGRVEFAFHPGATLISGGSGTGKSTLLDAYIALMMPSDTPFNGASNDAVAGRARSAEQRNLLSYLRGKIDTTTDEHGHEVDQVLRGRGAATWGAVGMTFVDDLGAQFSALRVYYVPARASRSQEITMRMATCPGPLDLADLAVAVDQMFAPKALKAAFPQLKTHETYNSFANHLYSQLGIGANGDGAKALRLLVRIQSGHQIRTVDELYKEMVLERPITFAAADNALADFDNLEASYLAIQTQEQKADLLAPITARHADLLAARAEIEVLDTFGVTRTGDTPLTLWELETEARLLDIAQDVNRNARAAAERALGAAVSAVDALDQELKAAEQEHRDSGGADLERIGEQITRARQLLDQRLARRQTLADKSVCLAHPLGSRADFDHLSAAAVAFAGTYTDARAVLVARRDDVVRAQTPVLDARRLLREERTSLEGRSGRVTKHLNDMRLEVAHAAGIDPADLPFVAELIDLAPGQGRWRTAVETVLGAMARTLLVPQDRLAHFSRAIDPLRLRGRLTFEGVPLAGHREVVGDPDRISGKVVYQDSPFSGWVQAGLRERSRDALCVETAAELAGDGYRVTLAGQTRNGSRGSHGRASQDNIIGFSSADAIADIDARLALLEGELAKLDTALRQVDLELADLERRRRAFDAAENYQWEDIDVPGVEERIFSLKQSRDKILAADDRLRALEEHIAHLRGLLGDARERRFTDQRNVKDLQQAWAQLTDTQDLVNDEVDRIGRSGRVELTAEQTRRLDQEFATASAPEDPDHLPAFAQHKTRLRDRLRQAAKAATDEAARAGGDLERTFSAFQLKWEDPNLGRSVESYPDYARILDDIVTTGLHKRRDEWCRRLTDWSGEDLVPLAGKMQSAVDEIEERLIPINEILRGLDFGAGGDRLRMRLRRLAPEHVTRFRAQLKALSSTATRQLTQEQLEVRFKELQLFMAQIRRRDDPRAIADRSDRERLLDVRKHVEITAERYGPDGQLLSTHSTLGEKSGGESQELVAFIVGAALRFRLGDQFRARPSFAPVFLDEGFVKSDAEFAGRAVQAWKGLGFQLIVGAPNTQVNALDPHMDLMLAITKDKQTHYSFVDLLRDEDTASPARAGDDETGQTGSAGDSAQP